MFLRRWLVWALLGLSPLPSVARADGAQCPAALLSVHQDELQQHYAVDLAIPAAIYDSTFNVGQGQAHISFDHSLALLSTSITSGGWFSVSVQVVERFDVTGVAPGTSVNAALLYSVDGWAQNCELSGCGVSYSASVVCNGQTVTADASQNGPGNVRSYLTGILSLPITLTSGSPLDATFSFNYRTPRFAQDVQAAGSGHYEVSGLPPGARVVTCLGGDPTPARRRTWGFLKLTYR